MKVGLGENKKRRRQKIKTDTQKMSFRERETDSGKRACERKVKA